MKSLKDVQKFENVFLISSYISEYDITLVVYTDGYYKDNYRVICISDRSNIHQLCVSKKCFDEGENTEAILEAPKGFENHYLICADEEVAREAVFTRMDNQERLYKDDIKKAMELIRVVNKKLNRLRRERNNLKKKNYGTQ